MIKHESRAENGLLITRIVEESGSFDLYRYVTDAHSGNSFCKQIVSCHSFEALKAGAEVWHVSGDIRKSNNAIKKAL